MTTTNAATAQRTSSAAAEKRAAPSRYLACYTLIPLHKPSDTVTKNGVKRSVGKAPIDKNWTKASYDSAAVLKRCIEEKRNIGVRLRRDQVVIDIDPRNGGDVSYLELFAELGIDESIFPRVVTGSGGLHLYATKLQNIPILDTLGDEYPGVEFKSKGRQVVSAGSIHPDTNKPYQWDDSYPDVSEAPPLPAKLLKLITKPKPSVRPAGGGEYDQEQIAAMLDSMDARKFRDQKKWLNLMMACHHASNGDARAEFVEFSTSDPQYRNDASVIGRRWDSLHRGKADGIKSGTLEMYVRQHGDPNTIPHNGAKAISDDEFDDPDIVEGDHDYDFDTPVSGDFDFDDPATDDDEPDEIGASALEALNEKHCAVMRSGSYCIMSVEQSRDGKRWVASSKRDFISFHENRRIENVTGGRGKTVSIGAAWQEWGRRKTAQGTCFDTDAAPASLVDGSLNLWTGFAVSPNAGSCERFKRMIQDDLCDGNGEHADFVLKWTAYKFQNPGTLPEIALVFVGGKGAGKTTFGQTLARIFGAHGMVASTVDSLTGRFNGDLEAMCFVFGDEAVWGGDKKSEARLKKLITDTNVEYEHKFGTKFQGINHIGLVLCGNDSWVAPASLDERRFFVSRVSTKHCVPSGAPADHPNRKYWAAVYRELNNGGREAFLHEMLNKPLGNWHPRHEVPQSDAMGEQKLEGLRAFDKWWFECLRDASLPLGAIIGKSDVDSDAWKTGDVAVRPAAIVDAYQEWFALTNRHANVSSKAVLTALASWGVEGGGQKERRERCWRVPRLAEARALFVQRLGHDPFGI